MWAWFIGAYLVDKELISTNEYTESTLQTLQSFDSGVAIGILKIGFFEDGVPRWKMHNLADIWLFFTINSQIWKYVVYTQGRFEPSFPGNGASLLSLRMYPGCEKVDPKVTTKTTLECISDLIQLERDLSLFTKFLYSWYFNQRQSHGHIFDGTNRKILF